MLIYAHRGASAEYPENTLAAFERALRLGVDGIELDLRASADGVPVVIHDRDLGRTTDGAGNVDDFALAELRALDAGRGERIPTLLEVLDLVDGAVTLDLEIKERGIERAVLDVLATYPGSRWAISSFDWSSLRDVRLFSAGADLWPLAEGWSDGLLAIAQDLGLSTVAISADAYTVENAETLRAAGLRAMVWTVNEIAEARRQRNLGAFALCTDDPARITIGLGTV